MSRLYHTQLSISPRRRPHHRTALARSISVQSTCFHLQISSQLSYKHGCSNGMHRISMYIVYCLCQLQSCELSLFLNQIRCVDSLIHIQAQVSSQNDAALLHRIAIQLLLLNVVWRLIVVCSGANVSLDQNSFLLDCTKLRSSHPSYRLAFADHLLSMYVNNQMRYKSVSIANKVNYQCITHFSTLSLTPQPQTNQSSNIVPNIHMCILQQNQTIQNPTS